MASMHRNAEQTLELKIERAEEKVSQTRAAHEKAVDELKRLYDLRKARQNEQLFKALESSPHSFDEIMSFIKSPVDAAEEA